MTLEKVEPGIHWPALLNEGALQGHTHLPLSQGMEGYEGLTAEELKQLQERVAVLSDPSHGDEANEEVE